MSSNVTRALLATLRLTALACAVVVVALAPVVLTHLGLRVTFTLALLVVLCAFTLRFRVPIFSFQDFGRRETTMGQTLDGALYGFVFALFGPYPTALVAFLSDLAQFALHPDTRRKEWLLDAALIVPFWLAMGLWRSALAPGFLDLSLSGFLTFVALVSGAYLAFNLLWFDVVMALRLSIDVRGLWSKDLSDKMMWLQGLCEALWSYLAVQLYLRDGILFGVAALVPLPIIAWMLSLLHRQRLALLRSQQSRQAICAAIESQEPVPQIQEMLSSAYSDFLNERLVVVTLADGRHSEPVALASIGMTASAMEHELQRSALERLETEALDVVIVRDGPEALAAYAMRDASAKLLGALTLSMCHHSLEPLHRRTLVDLAACLAPLIAEARMILNERAEAARDPLTDTLNRRAIESALQGVLSDPLRACECIVLLIDIDHFKRINDALGHKAGDRCLRELASAVRQRLRSGDHLGRLGGDEFLAVLPATKLGVAKGIIDRLERTDLSAVIHADGRSVTLSIGVIAPRPGESIEEVLERADRALYLAKRGGRHRTVFAGFEESGD